MVHPVLMPLMLREGDQHYSSTTINQYTPMTKEQTELFMKGEKYSKYVKEHLQNAYWYVDKNDYWQPRYDKNGKQFTKVQTETLMKNCEATKRKKDKEILMTEGIGGLQRKAVCLRERDENTICFWVFCLPYVLCKYLTKNKAVLELEAYDETARSASGGIYHIEVEVNKKDFYPGRFWYVPLYGVHKYVDPLT